MNFPSFGDAETFRQIGDQCALALRGQESLFKGCYNGIRSIGSALYFALPPLLSGDPVTQSYTILAFNLFWLALMYQAVLRIVELRMPTAGMCNAGVGLARILVGALTLLLALPLLPVALSDMPAATLFAIGLGFMVRLPGRLIDALLAGLFMALGGLIKQNYLVFSAFAVLALIVTMPWRPRIHSWSQLLRCAAMFAAGFSVSLTQVWWIWAHTGHVHVYDPAMNAVFADVRNQPNVELIAFSLPHTGAYISQLDAPVSRASHYAIKLWQGLFAYRHAVYLGEPPADAPSTLHVDRWLLACAWASVAAFTGICCLLARYSRGRREKAALVFSVAAIIFTVAIIHVENRYFFLPKLILLALACAVVCRRIFSERPMRTLPLAAGVPRLDPFNIIAYVACVLICALLFQQPDLFHTTASSYAYLTGHFVDFYDYNQGIVARNDYLPIIYVIFAIWMLPWHILGAAGDVGHLGMMSLSTGEILWAKSLLAVAFAIVAAGVYRCALLLAEGTRDAARLATVAFATSPIAIFAVFIFGQYDVIALCFAIWGFFFYLTRDLNRFAVLFAFAIPFKYFALLAFIPLLLFAEKRPLAIIRLGAIGVSLTLLQFLLYAGSPAFRGSIFHLAGTKLGDAAVPLLHSPRLHLALAMALICLVAYVRRPASAASFRREAVLFPIAAYGCFLASVDWHPQWLIITMPFIALSTILVRRRSLLLIGELFAMAGLVWVSANQWVGNVDATMLQLGVWRQHFQVQYMTMADLMPLVATSWWKLWLQIFLLLPVALVVFERLWRQPAHVVAGSSLAGLKSRMWLGVAFFVLPALACGLISRDAAQRWNRNAWVQEATVVPLASEGERPVGAIWGGEVVSQRFVVPRNGLIGVGLQFATYARINLGELQWSLTDSQGRTVAQGIEKQQLLRDNAFQDFRLSRMDNSAGQSYTLTLSAPQVLPAHAVTVWMTSASALPSGMSPAQAGDKPVSGALVMRLLYAR
ncbi:hypothetical protein GT347_07860 [Xylophilus rhododendri]|uniref:Uncharacterized protein n=1 Tax=Xylophilus rhododendri TaxID=2697032 RepID=A0A857J2P6_9BURK|nr:hypothetical protein [Xylophilus rhododendri]QHI97917.1 hypothetical protein GT347_07860 [Xylophilus rhododendri]